MKQEKISKARSIVASLKNEVASYEYSLKGNTAKGITEEDLLNWKDELYNLVCELEDVAKD